MWRATAGAPRNAGFVAVPPWFVAVQPWKVAVQRWFVAVRKMLAGPAFGECGGLWRFVAVRGVVVAVPPWFVAVPRWFVAVRGGFVAVRGGAEWRSMGALVLGLQTPV